MAQTIKGFSSKSDTKKLVDTIFVPHKLEEIKEVQEKPKKGK